MAATTTRAADECGDGKIGSSEQCETGACCEQCRFVSAGTECRAASGMCGAASVCGGNTATCPEPTFATDKVCDDGNAMTTDDKCTGTGDCVGTAVEGACTTNVALCDDKNPCTIDTCNEGKCVNFPGRENEACSDNNSCTLNDKCNAEGVCVGALECPFTIVNGVCCGDRAVCDEGFFGRQCSRAGSEQCVGVPVLGDERMVLEDGSDVRLTLVNADEGTFTDEELRCSVAKVLSVALERVSIESSVDVRKRDLQVNVRLFDAVVNGVVESADPLAEDLAAAESDEFAMAGLPGADAQLIEPAATTTLGATTEASDGADTTTEVADGASTTTAGATTTANDMMISESMTVSQGGLEGWALALIIIGAIAYVALVIVGAVCFVKSRGGKDGDDAGSRTTEMQDQTNTATTEKEPVRDSNRPVITYVDPDVSTSDLSSGEYSYYEESTEQAAVAGKDDASSSSAAPPINTLDAIEVVDLSDNDSSSSSSSPSVPPSYEASYEDSSSVDAPPQVPDDSPSASEASSYEYEEESSD